MKIERPDSMKHLQQGRSSRGRHERPRFRLVRTWGRLAVFAAVIAVLSSPPAARAQDPDPRPAAADSLATTGSPAIAEAAPHQLYLSDIQLEGATRTGLPTVYRFLPLRPGQAIDQAQLVDGVEALRAGGLFKSVGFYTKPGAERGQLVLVLEVVEHRADFRWAAGNTNLDGWYLVPAMVAIDNAFGDGGNVDLRWRIGLRTSGAQLRYAQPRAGDGRSFWDVELNAIETDRPYYADGVEYRHVVRTGGLALAFGRHLDDRRLLEFGLDAATVNVAHQSRAYTRSQDGSIDFNQEIPEQDLPPAIREAVGRSVRAAAHLDWQYDSRAATLRAGSPTGGLWGRVKGEVAVQENRAGHPALQADLRTFRIAPGGVLAARLRAAWVGANAAFYDRLYLGGMYSVRGFPTSSLSAPGGDTWLWSGSVEWRSAILSDGKGTKLAGVLFADAGAAGSSDADDPYAGVAVGAGYGLRLRVKWLDWVGVDIGFPLTARPQDMRFQGHASIGWSF